MARRFDCDYSHAMKRALLLALVIVGSCKKDAPKGDLPPATDWQAGAGSATGAPMPPGRANPHAGVDNPHAGVDNPHAGISNPHSGPTAESVAPTSLEKLPDGRLALGPFSLAAPADWTAKPITSSMRAADFVLPPKPDPGAELIVYYFGADGAGGVEDNVNRWVDQFEQPDGKASRDVAKIEKVKFGGQDATYVSLTGRYVAPAMPGAGDASDKPNYALLAAIVDSPKGPYYFKLVGPRTTLDASAKAFRAMLESLKVR